MIEVSHTRCLFIFLGLLIICMTATAEEVPSISVESDTAWLIAGDPGEAVVTATVTNGSSPQAGAEVVFSCDPALGSFSRTTLATNADGEAVTRFIPGTKSGSVVISAVWNEADGLVFDECVVGIDHAAPYELAFRDYEGRVMVDTETTIRLVMEDRYGNRIDSRHEPEEVPFYVGSPGESATFVESGTDTAICPVDETGAVTATLRTAKKAGENFVSVDLPDPISDLYLTVEGLSNAPPVSIDCTVTPSPSDSSSLPWVPADGESVFTLTCTLKDAYDNPSVNRSVRVDTSISGEEQTLRSNADGQIIFTYGPKESTGEVTITVTSVDDPSVTCSRTVEFTSTEPVDMTLSASPQTMPSLDRNNNQKAEIRAKVIDVKGNPVEGQEVTFSLSDINTGEYVVKSDPELLTTTAETNEDGYAIVHFKPGAFPRPGEEGYDRNSRDTCNVKAVWTYEENKVAHTLPLTWMNYPYLSVSTAVDPETVEVDKNVTVTITLKGDGYALRPDPIDVVLVIDRSGSMDDKDVIMDGSKIKRIKGAKKAASTFINEMDQSRDRVGLVSFAYSTSRDCDLGDSFDDVRSELESLNPDGATQLRRAIYEAVKMQSESKREDAVKAVIVMTDGDWNYDGDPLGRGIGLPDGVGKWSGNTILYDYYEYYPGLGGTLDKGRVSVPYSDWWGDYYYDIEKQWHCHDGEGTNQNMSNFARSNDVKLYAITFAYNPGKQVKDTMETMSTSTGGFYEHAPGGDELAKIYTRIAGELKTEAGVDTTMDLFEKVEVNGVEVPGKDVLDYQHREGTSTYIDTWIDNETGHYVPSHNPSYPYTKDQTSDWKNNHTLHFNIGDVHIGQTWTASCTFTVLKDGNINLFGPGSKITFNEDEAELDLPSTFITGVPKLNNTGINASALWVGEPQRVGTGQITDFLTMEWDLRYNGTKDAVQNLFYSTDEKRTWVKFKTMDPLKGGTEMKHQEAVLDVRNLPAAKYWLQVRATAPDAPPAENETSVCFDVGGNGVAKIRLQ